MATPQSVLDAIAQLKRHGAVAHVGPSEELEPDGHKVEIVVNVSLPSRARPAGISQTGVKAQEPATLYFGPNWPSDAPAIRLRSDFPRNLPHINPGQPGLPVHPCIYNGDLSELFHREGLDKVIDQLSEWLTRAASNSLVNIEQGWEPTRRDAIAGGAVFDADAFTAALKPDGRIVEFPAIFKGFDDDMQFFVESDTQGFRPFIYRDSKTELGNLIYGETTALLIGPVHADKGAPVCDQYEPESVQTLEELIDKANRHHLAGEKLLQHIEAAYEKSRKRNGNQFSWPEPFRLLVVLAIHRPAKIVSTFGRSIELLPYVVKYARLSKTTIRKDAKVDCFLHQQPLSPRILRTMSGIQDLSTDEKVVFLGCGSLGSKVSMHLARSGFGNQILVDNDLFAPHNAARHAIYKFSGLNLFPYKTWLMQTALGELSHHDVRAHRLDGVSMLHVLEKFHSVFGGAPKLLVDTSASLRVLDAACSSPSLDQSTTRYLRSAMLGQGRVAYTFLEAAQRQVRIDDLTAAFYRQCCRDPNLHTMVQGNVIGEERIFVGQNCSSSTSVMSDAKISRAASGVALQVERYLGAELPNHGVLSVGVEDALSVGMAWQSFGFEPTLLLQTDTDSGWEIRILADVADAITQDAKKWTPKEAGGVIVGHVHYGRRCLVIADLIEAPPDSQRSPNKFVLGTIGLEEKVRDTNKASFGYLHFLGTWHSHPRGGSHSAMDKATLQKIAKDAQGLPMVSLVWQPDGFFCEVCTL